MIPLSAFLAGIGVGFALGCIMTRHRFRARLEMAAVRMNMAMTIARAVGMPMPTILRAQTVETQPETKDWSKN